MHLKFLTAPTCARCGSGANDRIVASYALEYPNWAAPGSMDTEIGATLEPEDASLICPIQSGPKVSLDWPLNETEHGQERT